MLHIPEKYKAPKLAAIPTHTYPVYKIELNKLYQESNKISTVSEVVDRLVFLTICNKFQKYNTEQERSQGLQSTTTLTFLARIEQKRQVDSDQ